MLGGEPGNEATLFVHFHITDIQDPCVRSMYAASHMMC